MRSNMIGVYKKQKTIGQGSFGKVYLSYDPVTKEEVALKIIAKQGKRKRQIDNLRTQTQLLTKVKHQNIILLRSYHQTQTEIVIVMDYAGRDLENLLEKQKKLPLDKIKMYSKQILSAMLYLHENRILHRDLKPQNILLKGNQIKICDFGFAKKMSASTNFVQSIKGTPLYIAPQILNQKSYNHKVDIWSFGIIIYQLFVGVTPFYAQTITNLRPKILFDRVAFPGNMPAELKDLIDGMLQKDPQKRYDWDQVKNHIFFKEDDPKIEQIQKIIPQDKPNFDMESKVICRIDVDAECKQIFRIQSEIASGKVNPKDLKVNLCFYLKLIGLIGEAILDRSKIPNETLLKTFKIITLITKAQLQPQQKDDDITKNPNLIAAMLKLALQETNLEVLNGELTLIGYLLKNNFTGFKIDFDIDDDVTQLVAETLKKSTIQNGCYINSLRVLGILTSQAITTISHSQDFFTRVLEDKLLVSICQAYIPTAQHSIILELLEKFIHPPFQSISLLSPKCKQIFLEMKKVVAHELRKKGFIELNPIAIYGITQTQITERSFELEYHMNILYECLVSSKQNRQLFIKQKHLTPLSTYRSSRIMYLAILYELLHLDSVSLISKQIIQEYTDNQPTSYDNKLIRVYVAYFILDNMKKRPWAKGKIEAAKAFIQQIKDFISFEDSIKTKSCKEVLGFFNEGPKHFDQILIEIVHSIVKNPPPAPADEEIFSLIRPIIEIILKIKPLSQLSLLRLLQILQICPLQVPGPQKQKEIENLRRFEAIFAELIKKCEWSWLAEINGKNFVTQLIFRLMQISIIRLNQDQSNINLLKCIEEHQFYRIIFGEEGYLSEQLLQSSLHYFNRLASKCKTSALFDFIAVNGLIKIKPFFRTGSSELALQIINTVSYLARARKQNYKFLNQVGIVEQCSKWLNQGNELIKEKTLHLIGNLAKHSNQNFDAFEKWRILPSVEKILSLYRTNKKILKNAIYSIGNISFYNQRFASEIKPLIKYLMDGLASTEDSHFVINTISTISNLLRHSSTYLHILIETGITKKIMEIILVKSDKDKDMLTYGLNVLKKEMAYSQFWKAHSKEELREIYQKKRGLVKDDNECMKKIKECIGN